MASNKITYTDKVSLTEKGVAVNQWQDDDANEVKEVVNQHADEIDSLTAGQTGGLKSFTTLALLQAYATPSINDSYKVTNDPTTSNNGYYHWTTGTTYVQDSGLALGSIASGETEAVSGDTVFETTKPLENNQSNITTFIDNELVTEKTGYYIDVNGAFIVNANYKKSNIIDVVDGQKITYYGGTTSPLAYPIGCYNDSEVFIQTLLDANTDYSAGVDVIIPSGVTKIVTSSKIELGLSTTTVDRELIPEKIAISLGEETLKTDLDISTFSSSAGTLLYINRNITYDYPQKVNQIVIKGNDGAIIKISKFNTATLEETFIKNIQFTLTGVETFNFKQVELQTDEVIAVQKVSGTYYYLSGITSGAWKLDGGALVNSDVEIAYYLQNTTSIEENANNITNLESVIDYNYDFTPINSIDDLTLLGWSVSGDVLNSTATGFDNFAYYNIPLCEDKFIFSTKIKSTNVGDFECGLGKRYSTRGTAVAIAKDGVNSYLKIYKLPTTTTNATESVAERQTLPFDLDNDIIYDITLTKDVLDLKVEVQSEYGDYFTHTFSDVDTKGSEWGYPSIYNIIGTSQVSEFHFSYPFKKNPKLLIFGDSFIEGYTIRTDITSRYSAKIAEQLGVDDVVIMGRGGGDTASLLTRFYEQVNFFPKAKYCLLAIGTNNNVFSVYETHINIMISYLEELGIEPILVTITPRFDYDNSVFMASANTFVRSSGYRYLDVNKAVTTSAGDTVWKTGYLMTDNVHPEVVGHTAIYNRFNYDLKNL